MKMLAPRYLLQSGGRRQRQRATLRRRAASGRGHRAQSPRVYSRPPGGGARRHVAKHAASDGVGFAFR